MFGAPDVWDALMRKIAAISAAYLAVQVEAGASAVQLFDSWAGAMSPGRLPPLRDAVLRAGAGRRRRARRPADPLRGRHRRAARPDGGGRRRRGRASTGGCRSPTAYARVGGRAVQGNLDPSLVFAPTEVMLARATEIVEAGRAAPGHIFNLGHGVLPSTDPDQLARLTDHVHDLTSDADPSPTCRASRRVVAGSDGSLSVRRSRRLRAISVPSASSRCSQNPRNCSSQASTSPQPGRVDGVDAAGAVGPHGREAAVPEHAQVLGHRRLGDAELGPRPRRRPRPEECSPAASSSRIRRRTGSPSTSKACISRPRAAAARCRPRSRPRPRARRPSVLAGRDRARRTTPSLLPVTKPRRPRRRSTPAKARPGRRPRRSPGACARPSRPRSQPTPTAPGPNCVQRSSATCARCAQLEASVPAAVGRQSLTVDPR